MAERFNLGRTKQCAGCPWKCSVDPATIPNGFDYDSHEQFLDDERPGQVPVPGSGLRVMQCHDSTDEKPQYCVGWLWNQLGPGNNIGLRIKMLGCQNLGDLHVDGKQRQRFSDLLPNSSSQWQ